MQNAPLDQLGTVSPGSIDTAREDDANSVDFSAEQSRFYSRIVAELQVEVEGLKAENARLKAKSQTDGVRAGLMEPYANKVFKFLVGYCGFVGAILLLKGFSIGGFDLADYVIGIIAGSTAASAIGLVGFVVSGLFKPTGRQ